MRHFRYTSAALEVDRFVHTHPDLLVIFPAGEGAGTEGSVSAPGTCKNCITVGMSQSWPEELKRGARSAMTPCRWELQTASRGLGSALHTPRSRNSAFLLLLSFRSRWWQIPVSRTLVEVLLGVCAGPTTALKRTTKQVSAMPALSLICRWCRRLYVDGCSVRSAVVPWHLLLWWPHRDVRS